MDHFIARENIRRFRNLLWTEIGPDDRSRVQRLLVEEEDKLGRTAELLQNLDRHISAGRKRIDEQRVRIDKMQRDGHDGLAQAQRVLETLIKSQSLHTDYRRLVVAEIQRDGP